MRPSVLSDFPVILTASSMVYQSSSYDDIVDSFTDGVIDGIDPIYTDGDTGTQVFCGEGR